MHNLTDILKKNSKKSQVFSTDVIVAVLVFLVIIMSAAWFWDMTKEKIRLTETRNDLELITHNAASVLLNTVGDPPNWHKLDDFNDETVFSLGIGKNRPWIYDEQKIIRLGELNETDYGTLKRILGIRGASYEFHLNISKFNKDTETFADLTVIGKHPNAYSNNVIRVTRFGLSDNDNSWVIFDMLVWNSCVGAEC